MRGPLDALASWYSDSTINEALQRSIHDVTREETRNVLALFDTADMIAPPGSLPKAKALAAKAVFSEAGHAEHLFQLRQALSPSSIIGKDPISTDIITCHECAALRDRLDLAEEEGEDLIRGFDYVLRLDLTGHDRGFLGWTALTWTLLQAQQDAAILPLLERSLEQILQSDVLGIKDKRQLSSILSTAIRDQSSTVKPSRRRWSGASHDTGYESMSDDGESR